MLLCFSFFFLLLFSFFFSADFAYINMIFGAFPSKNCLKYFALHNINPLVSDKKEISSEVTSA